MDVVSYLSIVNLWSIYIVYYKLVRSFFRDLKINALGLFNFSF